VAGLYVHVPLRRSAHAYDESYAVDVAEADLSTFVTALQRELRADARTFAAEEAITTIYAGGGRPSLLPLPSVHSILTTVVDVFDASSFEEGTAEINPADVTPRYLRGLKRLGFDRLSIPILSFFPTDLQAIGAPHSAEESVEALRMTRITGFEDLSIDLLFGWPEQSQADWRASLKLAVELQIPHVTLIEATESAAPVAGAETRADQLEFAMTFLQSEGYEQYELTHFAKPGHRSAHQEAYYDHGNYLGLGPSAASFWWQNRSRAAVGRRWANVSDLEEYAALLHDGASPVAYRETLSPTALAREYVLLRLRTNTGIDLHRLADQYGIDLVAEHESVLDSLRERGLLYNAEDTIRLTNRGRLLADAIAQRLLPSD
jgi:oxygen-independent coproporphyrinogen-3 oxidase